MNSAINHIWTEGRIEQLRVLWCAGFSAREIAEKIGGSISRLAVIGKAHRINLPGRVPRQLTDQAMRRRRAAKTLATVPARVQVARETPAFETPEIARLSLLQLTDHTCKWPIGDPRDAAFGFCGETLIERGPYCPHHAARAFTGVPALTPTKAVLV